MQIEKVVETSKTVPGGGVVVGALRRSSGAGVRALLHEGRRRRHKANAIVVASLVGLAAFVAVLARLLT